MRKSTKPRIRRRTCETPHSTTSLQQHPACNTLRSHPPAAQPAAQPAAPCCTPSYHHPQHHAAAPRTTKQHKRAIMSIWTESLTAEALSVPHCTALSAPSIAAIEIFVLSVYYLCVIFMLSVYYLCVIFVLSVYYLCTESLTAQHSAIDICVHSQSSEEICESESQEEARA